MAARGGAYLAKGGDAEGSEVEDRLALVGHPDRVWRSPRIETRHTHGTGCTLSSAIAAELAKGASPAHAVAVAKTYLAGAIAAADTLTVGTGHGPVSHFYEWW
jgi:hydroxymethylpyrimidine/phosphomethylpyrimidine kinase